MYSAKQSSHSYKVNYVVTPSSKSIIKAQWLPARISFLTPLFSPSLLWSALLITFQCPELSAGVHTRPTLTFINHRQQIWHRGVTSPGPGTGGQQPIRGGPGASRPIRGGGTPGPSSPWSHPTTAEHN